MANAITRTIHAVTYDGERLTTEEQYLIKNWFYQAIYLHDLGKVNPAFQREKMDNKRVNVEEEMSTHHSLLSSLLYLELYEKEIESVTSDPDRAAFLKYFLYVFSYIISRHHSYLEDFSIEGYAGKLEDLVTKIEKKPTYLRYYANVESFHNFDLTTFTGPNALEKEEHNNFPLYMLTRLLYSAMVASDFYATYTYDKYGNKPAFRYLKSEDVTELRQIYDRTKVAQGIASYKKDPEHFKKTPINKLRSEMFLEAETELLNNHHENLFYLEAPTGGGKTNMSVNLALTLLENDSNLNKILYIFPFNSLVEQTKGVLDGIFAEVQEKYPISVINSVTPIVQNYEKKGS